MHSRPTEKQTPQRATPSRERTAFSFGELRAEYRRAGTSPRGWSERERAIVQLARLSDAECRRLHAEARAGVGHGVVDMDVERKRARRFLTARSRARRARYEAGDATALAEMRAVDGVREPWVQDAVTREDLGRLPPQRPRMRSAKERAAESRERTRTRDHAKAVAGYVARLEKQYGLEYDVGTKAVPFPSERESAHRLRSAQGALDEVWERIAAMPLKRWLRFRMIENRLTTDGRIAQRRYQEAVDRWLADHQSHFDSRTRAALSSYARQLSRASA